MNSSSKTNRIILWAVAAVLVIAGIGLVLTSLPNRDRTTETPRAVASRRLIQQLKKPAKRDQQPQHRYPPFLQPRSNRHTLPHTHANSAGLRVALPNPLPPELQDDILVWIAQQPGGRVVTDTQQADLWINTDPTGEQVVERITSR